jgi:hypothetical protein
MPLPHEQAAIDRAQGKKRERLSEAAAVLDRVRAQHPGVNDLQQLPPDVRNEALRALAEFRPGGSAFGTPELALLLLLVVGLGLTWFKPVRAFRCATQGGGLARCAISERLFGLIPVRTQDVPDIAKASTSHRTTTSESREGGRTRTTTTHIYDLSFVDAQGRELWSASESHLLGASLDQVGANVEQVASGELSGEIARVQAVWPALLAGTLFVTIAASALGSKLGLELRNRGSIPQALYQFVFYWGTLLVPVALYGAAWVLALLGKDPPAFLLPLL